jgi:hypothetical protein
MGGFLTDQWLGKAEPDPRAFDSSSLEKVRRARMIAFVPGSRVSRCCLVVMARQYFELIRAWGSWEAFQELLKELSYVAKKHRSCIAHVAMRWVPV